MWESKYVLSRSKFWRAIILNIIAIFGLVFLFCKFGHNPFQSIKKISDLTNFLALLAFVILTLGDTAVFVYESLSIWREQRREQKIEKARQEGLEQGRQELLRRFDQAFAGDQDAMEKRDQIFNGATETGEK